MRKPENKRDRGRGLFSDDDQYAAARKKGLKPGKSPKRIRWHDIDDDEA